MNDGAPIIWLTFFTLASGIVIVGGGFLYSLRRKRARRIASRVLLGENGHQGEGVPDGALPELAALFLFALAVMALLALGYGTR